MTGQLQLGVTPRTEILVRILGVPVAWPRARAAVRRRKDGGTFIQFFEEAEIKSWKATVAQHFEQARGGAHAPMPFPDGPLSVEILGVHPYTQPEAKRYERFARYLDRHDWRDRKPDPDNIAKCILDAANKVIWSDDGQVADLRVFKLFGPDPRLIVRVRALKNLALVAPPELLVLDRPCRETGDAVVQVPPVVGVIENLP